MSKCCWNIHLLNAGLPQTCNLLKKKKKAVAVKYSKVNCKKNEMSLGSASLQLALSFHCPRPRFSPWLGIPQVAQHVQKREKEKKRGMLVPGY